MIGIIEFLYKRCTNPVSTGVLYLGVKRKRRNPAWISKHKYSQRLWDSRLLGRVDKGAW